MGECPILKFFKENPYPKDEETVHKYAESIGMDPHAFEEKVYAVLSTFAAGGKAQEKGFTEADADPKELAMGIKVEMEHLDSKSPIAPFIAKKIALDHLAEFPDYYTRLKKLEDQAKAELGQKKEESTSIRSYIEEASKPKLKKNSDITLEDVLLAKQQLQSKLERRRRLTTQEERALDTINQALRIKRIKK